MTVKIYKKNGKLTKLFFAKILNKMSVPIRFFSPEKK